MTYIRATMSSGQDDERVKAWNTRERRAAGEEEVLVRKLARVDVGRGNEQEYVESRGLGRREE